LSREQLGGEGEGEDREPKEETQGIQELEWLFQAAETKEKEAEVL
jgi:hypothetical protein